MKRALWLLLAAFVLMWGGVLLRVGADTATAPAAAAPSSSASPIAVPPVPARATAASEAAPEEAQPQPVALARAAATQADRAEPAAPSEPQASTGAQPGSSAHAKSARRVALADSSPSDPEVTPPEELLGELGEGVLSPDFVEIETDYAAEPRNGPSATAEEQRIHALFRSHPIAKQVALVNCQDRVCRIVVETQSKDAFEQLLGVPGLSAATGIGPSTPYSLRSGQLSVYFRRADAAPR